MSTRFYDFFKHIFLKTKAFMLLDKYPTLLYYNPSLQHKSWAYYNNLIRKKRIKSWKRRLQTVLLNEPESAVFVQEWKQKEEEQ